MSRPRVYVTPKIERRVRLSASALEILKSGPDGLITLCVSAPVVDGVTPTFARRLFFLVALDALRAVGLTTDALFEEARALYMRDDWRLFDAECARVAAGEA